MSRIASLVVLLGLLTGASAQAVTITVRQDGSGDYTTINAALTAAAAGDLIRVGPGTYAESLTVSKSVTFESEGGAPVTILDGANAQRLVLAQGAFTIVFRGFTFTHARSDEGSALLVWQQADVLVEDCAFNDNYATGSNAVQIRHPGTSLRIRNSRFVGNRSAVHSGALSASMGANLYVEDCQFIENKSSGHGAMNAQSAHVEIQGCLFLGNTGGLVGALTLESCNGFVTGNTFHANSGSVCSVRLYDYTFFSRNIVSGEVRGYGLETVDGTVHTCNLYHDNHAGSVNRPFGSGEFVDDPLYCDVDASVFLVCSGSPALGGQGGCGPIGAYGQGCECGPIGIEQTTWGELKSIFR